MTTVALAQRDVLAQTTERLKVDLAQHAQIAAVYAEMSAIQFAREQAAASEAARLAAETAKLALAQAQLTAERTQSDSLREQLAECETTLQAKRAQLDESSQALSEARAAVCQLVTVEKFSTVVTELSTFKQQLDQRTKERDEARQAARVAVLAAYQLDQKGHAAEAELGKKDVLLKELGPKLQEAYSQLLRIKEKRDWRL